MPPSRLLPRWVFLRQRTSFPIRARYQLPHSVHSFGMLLEQDAVVSPADDFAAINLKRGLQMLPGHGFVSRQQREDRPVEADDSSCVSAFVVELGCSQRSSSAILITSQGKAQRAIRENVGISLTLQHGPAQQTRSLFAGPLVQ